MLPRPSRATPAFLARRASPGRKTLQYLAFRYDSARRGNLLRAFDVSGSERDAMYYVIGGDGQQYGPIDEATVRGWLGEGRVSAASLSFKTGETQWIPLRDRPELADVLAASVRGRSAGRPAGRPHADDDRLAEGVARRPPPVDLPRDRSASTASTSATSGSASASS